MVAAEARGRVVEVVLTAEEAHLRRPQDVVRARGRDPRRLAREHRIQEFPLVQVRRAPDLHAEAGREQVERVAGLHDRGIVDVLDVAGEIEHHGWRRGFTPGAADARVPLTGTRWRPALARPARRHAGTRAAFGRAARGGAAHTGTSTRVRARVSLRAACSPLPPAPIGPWASKELHAITPPTASKSCRII